MWKLLVLLSVLLLSACQSATVKGTLVVPSDTPQPTLTEAFTPTTASTPTPAEPTATLTATPVPFTVCCPLEDETFDSLPLILTNPLVTPRFGHDDGHHGIDFAYFQRGDRQSIQGIEVYAILTGKTVLTLKDAIPYGYTILIETPLSDLPTFLQESLRAIYQPVPETVVYQGRCPEITPPEVLGVLSVYHLYAHLEEEPAYQPGDPVSCGVLLGTVGNTGYSSNPHLHLETRLGPTGAELGDMAFYEPVYSEQQRSNYCLWRMSGFFQLFDPFLLFEAR